MMFVLLFLKRKSNVTVGQMKHYFVCIYFSQSMNFKFLRLATSIFLFFKSFPGKLKFNSKYSQMVDRLGTKLNPNSLSTSPSILWTQSNVEKLIRVRVNCELKI
jgi:hypothetical protein